MFASIKSCRPRCTNPKVGPFRFSVLHKSFSLPRGPAGTASQYSSQISVKIDITEIADTPCGRSLLAMNYSEVMFLLRLGVIQCLGDYHRSPSFLRFASSLFRLLERTLVPKFAIFRWQEHAGGCKQSQSFPVWTITLKKKGETRWLVFLTRRTFACRSSSSKEFLLDSRFLSGSRFSPHSSPLEHRPLDAISTVSCSFALRLAPGCSSARSGFFKLSFTRREMLLTKFVFQVSDHQFLSPV